MLSVTRRRRRAMQSDTISLIIKPQCSTCTPPNTAIGLSVEAPVKRALKAPPARNSSRRRALTRPAAARAAGGGNRTRLRPEFTVAEIMTHGYHHPQSHTQRKLANLDNITNNNNNNNLYYV